MRGEPVAQLLHEHFGIVEQAIDQIDFLAVEAVEARRQPLARDLRRIPARIVHRHMFGHRMLLPSGMMCRPKLLIAQESVNRVAAHRIASDV
jgi:hypothetical protein